MGVFIMKVKSILKFELDGILLLKEVIFLGL